MGTRSSHVGVGYLDLNSIFAFMGKWIALYTQIRKDENLGKNWLEKVPRLILIHRK